MNMILPKFDYYEPTTIQEACQMIANLGENAKPIAGGTDLIVNMKKKVITPDHLISLSRIDALTGIDSANGTIKIGACLTAAELSESDQIGKNLGALSTSAGGIGSPLIRNRATIAGNLITARPAADLPPPLMAYGAEVILSKDSSERSISLDDFFLGPGETAIEPTEILTEIRVPVPPPNSGAGYIKLGVRNALEISLVNVAAFLSLDASGVINGARVVLASVAPTPIRAPSAEKVLSGEKPSESLFSKAGEAASQDSKPIDDYRASAEYKRAMVKILTQRTLEMAADQAGSGT